MDLEAFELVLLRRPASAPDYPQAELDRIQREHVEYHARLRAAGHVRPDRLGEDHVAAALAVEPRIATSSSSYVDDARLGQGITVLSRAAPRHPVASQALADIAMATTHRFIDLSMHVATGLEDPRPLVGVLEKTVTDHAEPDVLAAIQAAMPETTTALAGLAAIASEHALATHLRLPVRDPAITAHLLIDLSHRLRQLGDIENALTAAEGAELYRRLTVDQRDSFLPNFATAAHLSSLCLGDLGRAEEALNIATVAVAAFRELAAVHPEAYLPELANSLSGQSNRYQGVGYRTEAVAAASEAVQLFMQLWDEGRKDIVMPDLARSLHNLAVHLTALGQPTQALEVQHDAIELRRRLAERNPDTYLPELASSLNNRANLLDELGLQTDGIAAIAETVEIYRQLSTQRPEVFGSDLAMALNNYSIGAAEVNPADALAASHESTEIYRSLAEQRPGTYRADLAMALNNLSTRLAQAGKTEAALSAVVESVAIRRDLAVTGDREIMHGLAASLSNLGIRLRALNKEEEATAIAREAVAVCRQLASQEPVYRKRLAEALSQLSITEASPGHLAESTKAAAEAVIILRELYEAQPAAHRRHWVWLL
jgi:tetratricopeptide repeat protein